jgi:hypothetical protein
MFSLTEHGETVFTYDGAFEINSPIDQGVASWRRIRRRAAARSVVA